MIGIFASIVIAVLLFLYSDKELIEKRSDLVAYFIFGTALIMALADLLVFLFTLGPLQKGEKGVTPRLIQTFRNDRLIHLPTVFLTLFLFLSYLISLDLLFFHTVAVWILLTAWTVLAGFAFDLSSHLIKRITSFLDPFQVLTHYGHAAQKSVQRAQLQEICSWIDTFTETALKSLARHGMSLALLSLENLRDIAKTYLGVAKSISFHDNTEKKSEHIGYILFYLFQRLELIFETALKQKQEPICSDILSSFGKIAIYSAKYDISMAPYPLHYIGRLAVSAQLDHLQEVGHRASLTLLEASKVILNEVDIHYVSIKDTFLTIVDGMYEIAEETFRKDKSISIDFLTKPFYDLKKLFQEEKIVSHPDQPAIVQRIDGVLSQFATLQNVLSTLPPLPDISAGISSGSGGI